MEISQKKGSYETKLNMNYVPVDEQNPIIGGDRVRDLSLLLPTW
jgi:hypothetical protein